MKKDELYVSVDEQGYRINKTNILNSQVDLLNVLKHLEKLKQMKIEKNKLKLRLYRLFSEVLGSLKVLEKEMPTPRIPKGLERHEVEEVGVEVKKPFSRYEEIDNELKEIQDRLVGLNS